ncbi:hypothetical protein MRS44_017807 [Fusarium solani]|uniref:uncharacterized protein n=1 Tax=Fusarium solani TaxID=169388 RepID=UPI0032C4A53D|nr:hypothetical protein MRS44_017807 [Fusarium solani]
MPEPGALAPDCAALFAEAHRMEELIKSRYDEMQNSLYVIEAIIQEQTSESTSRARTGRSKARRKGPLQLVDAIPIVNQLRNGVASFVNETIAKSIHPSLQASQVLPRTGKDGSPVAHDALAHTAGAGGDPSSRRSEDGALYYPTPFTGHAERKKQTVVDFFLSHLGSGFHKQAVLAGAENHTASDPSSQINAAAG